MRISGRWVGLAISAVLLVGAAPAARTFSCSTTDVKSCTCSGEQDCTNMRHSGQCNGNTYCSGSGDKLACFCAASRAAPGGGKTGGNDGPVKQAPTEARPPMSAQPP